VDLSKLTTSDKVIAGSGILLFIASFLPWLTADVEGFGEVGDANGWDLDFLWGPLPILLGLAAMALVLVSKLGGTELPKLPVTWGQAYLGIGALAAFLVVLKLLLGEDAPAGVDISRGFGFFIAAIAALGLAGGGFLKFQEEKTGSAGGPSF
jgi:hypothetical protein